MRRYAGGTGRTAQGTTFESFGGGEWRWQTYLEMRSFVAWGFLCHKTVMLMDLVQ